MPDKPRLFPTFRYRDPGRMIDWLTETLGFTLRARHMDGDTVAHAELAFGTTLLMLGQVRDDAYGRTVGAPDPAAQGGRSIYVAVTDPDALFARVVASGVAIDEPLTDRDYGSREFRCRDPEGNVWCFGTYCPTVAD
jgi:uncharacterized glyoxalase superfamily protein PhnB